MTNSPPSREYYRPRIGQAAKEGLLLSCRCELCRRTRVYVAADLLAIWHPETFLEDLWSGRCPRCGSRDFWRVRQRYPTNDDVGALTVRRLTGIRQTPLWKEELYSAPAPVNKNAPDTD